MTRAVFLAHTAAPSGAELATLRLLSALRDRPGAPFEVELLVTEDGPMVERVRARGIPVTVQRNAFDSRSMTIADSGAGGLLAGGVALLKLGWTLGGVLRERRADVLVAESTKALLMGAVAARRARIPLVWQVHDLVSREYFGRVLAVVVRVLGWLLARGVIANSRATLGSLFTWRRAAVVAYPGVEPVAAPDDRAPQRAPRDTVVAVVGRLCPWKGQDVLLRALAAARHRPRAVYIVGGTFFGEESYRDELVALSDELALPVEFVGHVEDPTAYMRAADILVHCSVLAEPFGQVVVEGMQAGCAVIAARAGGPLEIIRPGVDGFLVDGGDAAALARILDQLIADPELRTRLAGSARLRAREFGIDATAAAVAEVLTAVTAGSARRSAVS
ncbi:glycosyltransferase family 4 protein [Nocardia sp. NPDC057668]|uniref:glycosyltransferase family 4 protein n=1 Tax=Nocardia sp. NPDC057668 TaxID=3346202 RepID=UPI00366DA8E7